MRAEDFLNKTKRRLLRLKFKDFTLYDSCAALLDVSLSEVMSDSPDVEIGGIVVPELTLQFRAMDMRNHLDETITCEIGLEQDREDVSDDLRAIQTASGSGQLVFARLCSGTYLVGDGNTLYNCWKDENGAWQLDWPFESAQPISGICIEETASTDEYGHVGNYYGAAYLLHESKPYVTKVGYSGFTKVMGRPYHGVSFSGSEKLVDITAGLQEVMLMDMAKRRTSVSQQTLESKDGTVKLVQTLDVRYASCYDGGMLFRQPVSGCVTTFSTVSYGEFIITETNAQNEEQIELRCYGILHRLSGMNASGFFTAGRIEQCRKLVSLYYNFVDWLNENGIPVKREQQEYRNLSSISIDAECLTGADFSKATAAGILKEFAILEGGNAHINHDNRLELGWCGTVPVMTVATDRMGSLRIGTERLAPASGIAPFLNENSENVIETGTDKLLLAQIASEDELVIAWQNIIGQFANGAHLPFTGQLLAGGSPFLRAGDCVRVVTRSGAAVPVQIFTQDVSCFPFLQSGISTPEGTNWATLTVDFSQYRVEELTAEGWPEYLLDGFQPDTEGMTVTAHLKNGDSFVVESGLYSVETRQKMQGLGVMCIRFYDCILEKTLPILYPLCTATGQSMCTEDNRILAVRGGE